MFFKLGCLYLISKGGIGKYVITITQLALLHLNFLFRFCGEA